VLAEDGILVREGVVGLLTRFGLDVVAAVGDASSLVSAVSAYDPDLVITDVRMPPGFSDEGLRAAIALRAASPTRAVLVLSQYIELTYAAELLAAPSEAGVGYLLKDRVTDVTTFVDAVRRVAAGETVVDPKIVKQLLARTSSPIERLSPRERQVLSLMAEGRSNTAIARTLVLSEAAVAKNITGIFTRLGLPPTDDDNRRILAVLAYLHRRPP
jgi:DNA-binding NarL/FixJ family response regulator